MKCLSTGLPDAVYRLVFEHATDAILSVRLSTRRIEIANRRIEEMTGHSLTALVGSPIEMLFPGPGDGGVRSEAFSASVLDMPGLHDDLRIRRADQHPVFVSVAVAHVPDGEDMLAACVLRDSTERRLLEREVITKHMALRQAHEELVRVSRDLENRNRQLEDLSRRIVTLTRQAAIGAFTAGVAHGVNNPLAAVMSSGRQLGKLVDGLPLDGSRDRMLELLRRQHDAGLRIQHLIEDMRKVHRRGASAERPVLVDVRAEIDSALRLFEHRLTGVEIVRRYAEVPMVGGYPDGLQQLFTNLIDNALLAMEDSGTLTVAVSAGEDRLHAAIEDTGPGLAREVAARLFEPFVTAREDGTGLGLFVAQRLAHMHGGRLAAEAVVPHGARFVFDMPLAQPTSRLGETT